MTKKQAEKLIQHIAAEHGGKFICNTLVIFYRKAAREAGKKKEDRDLKDKYTRLADTFNIKDLEADGILSLRK